jgi:uncharacterized protein
MTLASDWRIRKQRLSLQGEMCPHCGARLFPPRDVCPHCTGPAQTSFVFSGRGTVYSFSTVYAAPAGFEENAPYTVALIKLDEGPLVTAQLADVEGSEVAIGMPVEMVTRRMRAEGDDGLILYNYKFRPILQRVTA